MTQTQLPADELLLETLSAEEAVTLVRIKLLAAQRISIWVGNVSVASLLTLVFWQETHITSALWWCFVHFILTTIRFFDIRRFSTGLVRSAAQRRRFLLNMTVFAFITGTTWGVAPFLFMNVNEPVLFIFLNITVACIAVGALPGLTMYFPAYAAFALPLVAGMVINLALQDTYETYLLAVLACGFGAIILAFARNLANATTASITMEREMAELLQEVSEAKDHIEEISADKSRFLAAISHDVSQPLYSMMLYLQTLKNKSLSADQNQLLDKLENSTHSLHEMFNSMLEVARLEQGAVDSHETSFPLSRILKNLEDEMRVQAEEKGLEFQVDTSTTTIVSSDSVLLARILRNLIGNAIKYTERGFIRVSVEQKDSMVMLHVQDSGPGIAAAEQENIFQEYRQIDNPERNYARGLGLGLSVVNKLVALLDHELTLKSTLGEGSTFTLALPAGEMSGEAGESGSTPTQWDEISGLHIMVLEDDENVREGLSALLLSWGCLVTAEEEVDALITATSNKMRPPDLLLSDYRLPGAHDGIAATQIIRERIDPQLPCIIVSGDAHEAVVSRAQEHGLAFLGKPVVPEELRVKIADSV